MCEQTEIDYLDGEVVWVKLGSCWWPGEVVDSEKLPPDVLQSFRKPPIAVVKFFEEDSFEYVKNINSIYKYNCSRKNEFINKGLYMYRNKHGTHMEKFPEDVIRAETKIGGDIEILTRDEFQEAKKESYAGIFGDPKKTPGSLKKVKSGRGRPPLTPKISTPIRKFKEKTDYKVHILLQGSKPTSTDTAPPEVPTTPSTSGIDATSEEKDDQDTLQKQDETQNDKSQEQEKEKPPSEHKPIPTPSTPSTPSNSSSGSYACHACPFTTTRLNVLILHTKTHSVSFTPYTPSPVRKKPVAKSPQKSTPNLTKTPKPRKPRKEKTEKPPKPLQAKKRSSEEKPVNNELKKPKTDEEIKSSLLADWDDDVDDESNDESSTMASVRSPEFPVGAESPAVPTPAELPSAQVPAGPTPAELPSAQVPAVPTPVELPSAHVPAEMLPLAEKKPTISLASEKPESSSDSKYEFCEDEDWPEEADFGRKIPRVKNPIRTEETKSVSIDEDEMAREVAELLNKTAVPQLPSVPEPLKIEENFPEPSVVKSPDKKRDKSPEKSSNKETVETEKPPIKAIFKTKTFFRSRHSRSQDAIGKYVAEQLNAVERMDIAESETNGSDAVSSPEARDSPPIEPVKVARLAPKIQLKKMKAEAAQLREKEKIYTEHTAASNDFVSEITLAEGTKSETPTIAAEMDETDSTEASKLIMPSLDVLYPTREIKPLNSEVIKEPLSNKEEVKEEEKVTENPTVEHNYISKELQLSQDFEREKSGAPITEQTLPEPAIPETDVPLAFDSLLNDKSQDQQKGPYMNETTASAVDALLSVSREADRVPRAVTNDLPDDLFEDDKDGSTENVNGDFNENMDQQNDFFSENNLEKTVSNVEEQATEQFKDDMIEATSQETLQNDEVYDDEVVITTETKDPNELLEQFENQVAPEPLEIPATIEEMAAQQMAVIENVPSESDLQVAEALINLPSTAIQNQTTTEHKDLIPMSHDNENILEEIVVPVSENVVIDETVLEYKEKEDIAEHVHEESGLISNNDTINTRFETEQEICENFNAAQSLVQMSGCIDHKLNVVEPIEPIATEEIKDTGAFNIKQNNGLDTSVKSVEQSVALLSNDNKSETVKSNSITFDTSSSKLLKILEEPCKPKVVLSKPTPTKQILMQGNEKILNFDVAKSTFKSKTQSPKQKIIIRRTNPCKTVLNKVNEITGSEKIILSRSSNPSHESSSMQTFTIQTSPDTPSDANTIIIQQKIRKITKPATKLQKMKPQTSLVVPVNEIKKSSEPQATDDAIFDINSMPIVLSEDLLTPESIEKMPVVMSDGGLLNQSQSTSKVIKSKQNVIEQEKIVISGPQKPEPKTLLMNPITEGNKSVTPNILSKSSKIRGAKPMLVIDKATGKQKIIMTKAEPAVKEHKQMPTLIQSAPQVPKAEKFIILPTQNSPRPARTQKIVIDPQTGKAHVFVTKGNDAPLPSAENKPVSAKLVPSNSDASAPGNTVMIITNAQGAQSRIVLTPEHEKILFPNKQQPNLSQLKTITHRIATNATAQKTVVTSIAPAKTQTVVQPVIAPARIVPKQKSAIITSKGQLIVGGRVATTAQNIAPMPEIRPAPTKRILASEPQKLVQAIQKTNSEPIIFLQQKSGAVMQLTAAQFEHLQRTGQIVQKPAAPIKEKIVIQKAKPAIEPCTSVKSRSRKAATDTLSTPAKKVKHEIPIAPAPPPPPLITTLTPLLTGTPATTLLVPSVSNTVSVATSSVYPEFDNFEEMLPSTAIARKQEPVAPAAPEPMPAPAPTTAPAPAPAAPPAQLSDGQLLAVPGEHFGGPVGTFYLCVEENGTFTPIDNRPLVLENNQLVPMNVEATPAPAPQPERRDILEAALANSDVFHADVPRDDAPDFRDLNANVSVHCRVSETSSTLNQPIMTPVEMPTKADAEPTVPSSLEDGLAVIGVTPHTVPTSLELPITVTDPRIAPKTADPLGGTRYGPTLLPSPGAELAYVSAEAAAGMSVVGGPISMPLLTDEEEVCKSMPILTEEAGERGASSADSATCSPASLDARDADEEGGGQWARRLLTPGSDCSENSAEIPLQPSIQLSVNDLHHS